MAKRDKKTKPAHMPRNEKYSCKGFQPDSFFDKAPCWRFHQMDKERWSPVGYIDSITEKLSNYEKMTWAEIDGASKSTKGSPHHFISVNDMIKEARERLDLLHLTYEQYYSIALTGRIRLWGVLEDGIFHILWYDPNHEVCPSNKQHT